LKPVALRLLNKSPGLAPGLGDEPGGIGFGFQLRNVLIPAAPAVTSFKRRDALSGGRPIEIAPATPEAGLISQKDFLHEFLHVVSMTWRSAVRTLTLARGPMTSRMALSATAFTVSRWFEILKRIILGVHRVDLPDHDKFDVGDIFGRRSASSFLPAGRAGPAVDVPRVLPVGEADIYGIAIGD